MERRDVLGEIETEEALLFVIEEVAGGPEVVGLETRREEPLNEPGRAGVARPAQVVEVIVREEAPVSAAVHDREQRGEQQEADQACTFRHRSNYCRRAARGIAAFATKIRPPLESTTYRITSGATAPQGANRCSARVAALKSREPSVPNAGRPRASRHRLPHPRPLTLHRLLPHNTRRRPSTLSLCRRQPEAGRD